MAFTTLLEAYKAKAIQADLPSCSPTTLNMGDKSIHGPLELQPRLRL